VELLESRLQPGSVLTGGSGLSLLGSALDLNRLAGANSDTYAVIHRRLKFDDDTLTGSPSPLQGGQAGTVSTATITLTQAPAPATANNSTGVSLIPALPAATATGHAAVGGSATAPIHLTPTSTAPVAPPVQGSTGGGQSVHAVQAIPQVAHPVFAPAGDTRMTSGAGAHITTVHFNGGGDHPPASVNWSTYLSQAGASLSRDAVGADGNLYAVGTIPDASNGGSDILVAQVSTNGSSITISTVSIAGSTFNAGKAIAVDTSGSDVITYLGGTTDAEGQTTYLVARYDFTAQAVNWTVMPSVATRSGSVNGLALDGAGNLFMTGWEDGSFASFPKQSILTVQYTDLANNPPTVVNGWIWSYGGFDNDPGTGIAFAINTVIFVSENFYDPTDTTSNPGVGAYDVSTPAGQAFIFQTDDNNNPIVGSMNDVIGNSSGQAYSAGTFTDAVTGRTDALVVNANFASGQAFGVILTGTANNNLAANGISATTSSGNLLPVVVGTDDSMGSVDMTVLHFTSDLATITDSAEIGGSNTDVANGVATDSNGNAYVVGTTNSPDFPVTNNSTYGGDPSDGVIFSIALS
jgi:hypothetical protein